jgi:PAS domain S-box-containing protein
MGAVMAFEDAISPDAPGSISAGLQDAIFAPLVISGEIIGALSVRSRTAGIYNQKHADLTKRIANQVAGSVVNSELHRELADIEARSRAVVETAAVGIVTADERLTIQTVNDAVLNMFGYAKDELIGKNVMELAAEPYRSEHPGYIDRYNRTDEPRIIGTYREVKGLRKDGTIFPMELEVTRVDLERGRMYTGVIRDITDRKLAETKLAEMTEDLERRVTERTSDLEDANAQLKQSNSELEAFSYMVSHDLRGPLSMSAQLASRLLDSGSEELSESSRHLIKLIEQSSRESSEFVDDLLNFARVGQQALSLENVDVTAVVKSAQSEFSLTYPAVSWTLNLLPDCEADPGLLRAVFANLLSNAYKFTSRESEPSIEVGSTDIKGEVAYYVRDNGVGFDMTESHRMFDVFERLHRPEDYPGTGAGLAIVRRIVERHGGRVCAESEVGKGATFYFTLGLVNEPVRSS